MAGFTNWNFTRTANDRIDDVVWSVSNTQTILELTKAGFGATVIANRLVERDLAEGALLDPPPAARAGSGAPTTWPSTRTSSSTNV